MTRHPTARAAWPMCVLTLIATAGAGVLTVLNTGDVRATRFAVLFGAYAVVGGLVASRRPANVVGWCFLGSAACFAGVTLSSAYASTGSSPRRARCPWRG